MPETKTNGYTNGNRIPNGYEMEDDASFLFTSESVGEGHPGEYRNLLVKFATFDGPTSSALPRDCQNEPPMSLKLIYLIRGNLSRRSSMISDRFSRIHSILFGKHVLALET